MDLTKAISFIKAHWKAIAAGAVIIAAVVVGAVVF